MESKKICASIKFNSNNLELYSNVLKSLLLKISRIAGFSSNIGLFNGKIGVAILLHHAAKFLQWDEIRDIANYLLDDVIEGYRLIKSKDFIIGVCGISWGLNYLMTNDYIDVEQGLFNDMDNLILEDKFILLNLNPIQYSYLGLYINSRYNNSLKKKYWAEQAYKYCQKMYTLIKENKIFFESPYLLKPFIFCLFIWEKTNPFLSNGVINLDFLIKCRLESKASNTHALWGNLNFSLFFNELDENNVLLDYPKSISLVEINSIFLDSLLYDIKQKLPNRVIDNSFNYLVTDNQFIDSFLSIINPQNLGISSQFTGLAWSLLKYLEDRVF